MSDKLEKVMQEFCAKYNINFHHNFSMSLSQKEINIYNLFFSGKVLEEIHKFPNSYMGNANKISKQIKNRINRDKTAVGIIEKGDVLRIQEFLLCVEKSHLNQMVCPNTYKYYDAVVYSLLDDYYFSKLKEVFLKIEQENLVGTLPKLPIRFSWFPGKNFQIMIHECIHFILQSMHLWFDSGGGISPLDEGFCVYLHSRFNKHFDFYENHKDPQYRNWASYFAHICRHISDDTKVIPWIVRYSQSHNMIAEMRELLKEGFNVNNEDLKHISFDNHIKLPAEAVFKNGVLWEYQMTHNK